MKKLFSYSFITTVFAGCVGFYFLGQHFESPNRLPSSLEDRPPAIQILDEIGYKLESKSSWEGLCSPEMSQYYNDAFLKLPLEENIYSIPQNEISALVEQSFKTRLALRAKLEGFDMEASGAKECWAQVRSLYRNLRYLEDYLIEAQMPSTATAADYTTFEGDGSYFLKNPDFQMTNAYSLQSGDVILSRGNAFVSALIARITEIPNQFSHISFVYKDKDGKLWTIESHIEIGAVVAPMANHVDEKNARSVVFRYKDPKVSHAAAEYIFNLVKAQQATGKNVQYDFGMGLDDPKRLFCSEVAYQGFWLAAKVSIPKYKNKFPPGLVNFLKDLGVKANEKNILTFETFAPGDIEYDTDFSLVAEWRNPAKMKLSRFRDALMSKEVEWMTDKGYRFYPGFKTDAKSYFAWLARRTPFVKKKLEEKFPLNMTPGQMQVNIAVEETSGYIENKLFEMMKTADHQYTYEEILEALEKLREEDFAVYSKDEKSLFHHRFRPKK